jgi:hypothetical protein
VLAICSAPIQIAIFAISGSAGHNHFAIRRRFCAVAASMFWGGFETIIGLAAGQ